ncbi:hypothetical protein [Pontibacter ramchanderi]|uniref:Uncharacterized protein n=1 Tax=Pontibacter ramchanderi TaxID=1179743 RepID=A0A2N3U8N6_9BACT|nr:hypothetical protein [Pontibacter ramchanderi]PKV63113.1 hypothetical protein BD749_2952 [Pontibacter ramchanderi]
MLKNTLAGMVCLLISLAACQSPDNAQTEQTGTQEAGTAAADTVQRQPRPKPEHYSFKGVEKTRVYICMDETEDTFHQKHDCPVLVSCKSTFRNLTLPRAVEAFGRYNCETCSADLAYVFDEDAVQFETGL